MEGSGAAEATRCISRRSGTVFACIDFIAPQGHPDGLGGRVFMTLPPGALTGYPQAKSLFRSEKRAILAIERLSDSLAALKARVDDLESASKKLQLEWTETYDKIRHQLSRMARRGDLKPPPGNGEIVDESGDDEPKMDPISAGIHARRGRMFLGGK